jgi:hypothetical protein
MLAAVWVSPPSATAQEECDPSDVRGALSAWPIPGGPFPVMLNAPVRVRYSPGYFEDPLIGADPAALFELVEVETGFVVPGRTVAIGEELVFTPAARYFPDTEYAGTARGVDALDQSIDIRFTTGVDVDSELPSIRRIDSMRAFSVDAACDLPDGGYRIEVQFEPATDDGPPGDIEHLLYVSRGPEVEAPQRRDQQRNLGAEGILAFTMEPAEAVSPICVTVVAVDGVGNVAQTPAFCDDPIKGNFFAPLCSAYPPTGAGGALPLATIVAALWIVRRRRRRR